MVRSVFAKQNFDWKEKLHTCCTDGASAILGNTSGVVTLVKKEAPHITTGEGAEGGDSLTREGRSEKSPFLHWQGTEPSFDGTFQAMRLMAQVPSDCYWSLVADADFFRSVSAIAKHP